jgi:hypothetical protein
VGAEHGCRCLKTSFFICDENLHNCKPILDALTQHGVKHERHGSHFLPGTEDTTWLPLVGEKGWLLVT